MTTPLEDIRVLDFGQYIAGPATAMMLADQGAEVIRIDPPGGPKWASPAMDILNRRKKSIVLDLKKKEDLKIGELIHKFNFYNFSDFSNLYKNTFHETPSQTLALK